MATAVQIAQSVQAFRRALMALVAMAADHADPTERPLVDRARRQLALGLDHVPTDVVVQVGAHLRPYVPLLAELRADPANVRAYIDRGWDQVAAQLAGRPGAPAEGHAEVTHRLMRLTKKALLAVRAAEVAQAVDRVFAMYEAYVTVDGYLATRG